MEKPPAAMSRKALINTVILSALVLLALVLFFLFERQVERLL